MTDSLFGVMRAPRTLLFGDGQRYALGKIAASLGRRVLICTDERFAGTPAFTALMAHLDAHDLDVRVFDQTQAELPIEGILACADLHRADKPDVIVGLGGGSCMDLAKLVSLLLTHGGTLDQYYGEFNVPGPVIPVIAIPTTAGTGSEVTPVAVLADSARALKVGVSSPHLIPHAAICDPELTWTCPPGLTAIAGADAMTHAIEALTAVAREPDADLAQTRVFVGKNAFSDHHALSAITALTQALPRAVADGSDRQARSKVMFAAVSAGLAFGVAGTAAAHAIQYPVGALTHSAHGLGVAALMPYVMQFNHAYCIPSFAQISRAMGATEGSEQALAEEAPRRVAKLFASIGIPRTLAELGVKEDQLDWIAEQSLLSARLINNNPRPLALADVAALTRHAFYGEPRG